VRTVARSLAWAADAQQLIDEIAPRLTDADVRAPSALPGWSRGHVLTHLARNADALVNLMTWARTGVPTPMYVDNDQRARDIDAGSGRDAAALARDNRDAAARFADAAASMPATAWDVPIVTNSGRTTAAADVPWMRVREVWLHVVDLSAGPTIDDIPSDVAWELVREVAAWMTPRVDVTVDLIATGHDPVRLGAGQPHGEARGTVQSVAAWLTGRTSSATLSSSAPLPDLPSWL
jgi:maleylpyruvate isomerase